MHRLVPRSQRPRHRSTRPIRTPSPELGTPRTEITAGEIIDLTNATQPSAGGIDSASSSPGPLELSNILSALHKTNFAAMPKDAARPPSLAAPSSVVTIIVLNKTASAFGKDIEQKYVVHKHLLCYHSPFFAKGFNGPFQEGTTQTMQLKDVEADIFGLLVYWIYHQTLEGAQRYICPFPGVTQPREDTVDVNHFVKLWILGDRFLMPALQNAAIDAVFIGNINPFSSATMTEASKLAYSGDFTPLRKLLVFKVAWTPNSATYDIPYFDNMIERLPAAMVIDIAKLQKAFCQSLSSLSQPKIGDKKDFHVKEDQPEAVCGARQ